MIKSKMKIILKIKKIIIHTAVVIKEKWAEVKAERERERRGGVFLFLLRTEHY